MEKKKDLIRALIRALDHRGASEGDLAFLERPGAEPILRFVMGQLALARDAVFEVILDHRKDTFDTLIRDGEYAWRHPNATAEHFPLPVRSGVELVTIQLLGFGVGLRYDVVRWLIPFLGFQLPTMHMGLAFGAIHGGEQRKGPIAILCPHWIDPRRSANGPLFPILRGRMGGRGLDLARTKDGFSPHMRFLAVCSIGAYDDEKLLIGRTEGG